MRSERTREGAGVAQLSAPLFQDVAVGKIKPARGAIIGLAGLSDAQQAAVLNFGAARKLSHAELGIAARIAREAGSTVVTNANDEQGSLFGVEETEVSNLVSRIRTAAWIEQQISRDKTRARGIAKKGEAEAIETAGMGKEMDSERAAENLRLSAQRQEVFAMLSTRSGPVATLLNDAANAINRGENVHAVRRRIYPAVLAAVDAEINAPAVDRTPAADGSGRSGRDAGAGAAAQVGDHPAGGRRGTAATAAAEGEVAPAAQPAVAPESPTAPASPARAEAPLRGVPTPGPEEGFTDEQNARVEQQTAARAEAARRFPYDEQNATRFFNGAIAADDGKAKPKGVAAGAGWTWQKESAKSASASEKVTPPTDNEAAARAAAEKQYPNQSPDAPGFRRLSKGTPMR